MCNQLIIKDELSTPNCRREYFRQYYLDNKKKYIKDKEDREVDVPKKKRGRPKKVIPPFTFTSSGNPAFFTFVCLKICSSLGTGAFVYLLASCKVAPIGFLHIR